MRLAYNYPTRDRAPGTSVLEHQVISPIEIGEVSIEGIRQFDPGLAFDSKIDRVLLNPAVLRVSAHIRRLLDFDPLRGDRYLCRLVTIKH
jgi:hypothetical protein